MREIQITCDGSSFGNGQSVETRAACAALLTDSVHWRATGSFLGSLTNQQAELMAAALALEVLRFPSRVTASLRLYLPHPHHEWRVSASDES